MVLSLEIFVEKMEGKRRVIVQEICHGRKYKFHPFEEIKAQTLVGISVPIHSQGFDS
jgi:hypothetical protein